MSLIKIRMALEKRLNLLTPALPIDHENLDFTALGLPHLRAFLLPNRTSMPGLDMVTKYEKGIFQVSVAYPLNQGTGEAEARVELVRAHFPAGLKLVESGVTVLIYEPPSVAAGQVDGVFFVIPVSISYRSFIT